MKLLIGVDGSSGSFEAVTFASRLIDGAGDQIALYYSPVEAPLNVESVDAAMRDRARQALADAVFAEARKRLPASLAQKAHTIVGLQAPAQGLVLAADSWRADVIVVGARGLGPVPRVLLGSVSHKVAQSSEAPVLVVRPGNVASEGLRLLLAHDPSGAKRQAEVLGLFTWPKGTTGRVMRVVESLLAGSLPAWLEQQARDADAEAMAQAWISEHEADVRQQREELTGCLVRLPAVFHGQAPIVLEGHPADQILKVIADEKIDLVIVGKTTTGPVMQMLVGSTSGRILNDAPCSVLMIPPHETP